MSDLDRIRELCPAATWTAYDAKEAWLAAHLEAPLGLGGSEAAVAVGASRWDTPLGLWARKRGLAPAVEETRAMRVGVRLEQLVADEYAAETGRALLDPGRYTLARSRAHPRVIGSIDRLIVGDPRGLGVLEIKTTGAHRAHEWEDGQMPREVAVQLAHYLALLGASWGSAAVLIGSHELRWLDVARDVPFEIELLDAEAAFLASVENGDAPLAQAEDSAIIRALYPQHVPGQVVALPGEAMDWDTEIVEAKAIIAEATTRKDAAENALKQALATSEQGVLPNGVVWTYRASARGGYTVEPSTTRTLRRKATTR